ncbi:MAG TPA: TIGR00269 family protein, partial [Candidatus Nitrosotalea sp.]|nr:TIGR00269 family protein [Candidatus Nitrosotalea sp.]
MVVYSRKYSGENLCSKCFSSSIVNKTTRTISKYNMIKSGDVVGVAVSGGKDSLSLLQILKEISL